MKTWWCGVIAALLVACGTSDPMPDAAVRSDGSPSCMPGTRDCECASGLCGEGLRCESDVCRSDGGEPCGDTSSDPNNCGACGVVCESGVCVDEQCGGNTWSECFTEGDGFTTCEEVCASTGASCAAAGCEGDATVRAWGGASETGCEINRDPRSWDGSACDAALTWGGSSTYKRCCCTGGP